MEFSWVVGGRQRMNTIEMEEAVIGDGRQSRSSHCLYNMMGTSLQQQQQHHLDIVQLFLVEAIDLPHIPLSATSTQHPLPARSASILYFARVLQDFNVFHIFLYLSVHLS